MNITGKASVADVENVELDITIRAKVSDWRRLVDQMPNAAPSWRVARKRTSQVSSHLTMCSLGPPATVRGT